MINWIKAVFEHHMSLLSSLPEKEEILHPFYAICNSRVAALRAVTDLHSRVDLVLAQAKSRRTAVTEGKTYDALLAYKEGDSSDEEEDFGPAMGGFHSESEDAWDFLADEEEEPMEDDDDDEDIEMLHQNGDNDDVLISEDEN